MCGCGTFAEAMVVDEASLVPVQTDLTDDELALLGCGVTTGLGAALNTAEVTPGSSVAVIGCGGVGQSVIQGARIAGAAVIIAIDPSPSRRDAASRVGATHAIDPAAADPIEQVRELTDGRGADFTLRGRRPSRADGRRRSTWRAPRAPSPSSACRAVTDQLTLPAIQAVFSGKRLQGRVGRRRRRSCATSPATSAWPSPASSTSGRWCPGTSPWIRSTRASTWCTARKASAPLSSERASPDSASPDSPFRLDGQVAVVTGASSGLGEAAARALAGAGATVAVVARRGDRIAALAREIGGHAVTADLTDDDAVASLIPNVASATAARRRSWSTPRATSRAGATRRDEKPDAIRATLELNLVTPFRLAQQAFPHMAAAGRGSVINVSSISGQVGIPGIPQASYAASKAGLSGLTVELAVQWARHGIRVNTIAPGFFRSEITGGLYDDERSAAWLRRNTPLPGRAAPRTSPARCCGWPATPGGTSPGRRSSLTAAGPRGSPRRRYRPAR